MSGVCNTGGGEQRCIQDFGGKPEGKRPLGRPRHRWQGNNKMNLGMWGHGLDQAGSGEGQVAGACECGNEISGSIKCEEFLD